MAGIFPTTQLWRAGLGYRDIRYQAPHLLLT
jgi:hypothetical protein